MPLKADLPQNTALFRANPSGTLVPSRHSVLGVHAADKDAADLLYRHGVGGLFVSCLASSALTFMAFHQAQTRTLFTWFALMLLVLIARAADIAHFRRSDAASRLPGQIQVCRFGVGLLATGLLWAAFPLAFFTHLDQTGRAFTAIVLSGMVGGSATVLAPSIELSVFYCAALLLPTSLPFFLRGGGQNTFLGVLRFTFFIVMSFSSRVTHRATMNAIRLGRTNEALAVEMKKERQRAEAANHELQAAQLELRDVNRSLESRIEARTTDLEKEIREKEHYAKELAYLASMDPLTGICNRPTMGKRLGEALARAEASRQSLAVLFVDLDKFKEVNDVLGHFAGDRVLRTVAGRLYESLTPAASLARWGGDEFVVALPGPVTAVAALELADTLRKRLCDPIEVDLGIVTVDATVGIALFPEHGRTQDDLIRAADMAMYDGKEKHFKVRLFDPSLSERLTERHMLERSLHEAVGNGALSLVFQPIVAARTGHCEIVEALARWHHPNRGFIPPSQFIPIAERTGEINAIGRWVLLEACREAAAWQGTHPPAVSVNVSAVQITSGSLVADVMNALEQSSLPANRLHLELTESVFAVEQSINPSLNALRKIGVSISLDDFGTGFSCLSYLRTLPIDMIKIDRSFVASVGVDSGPIINTIVTTAQTFGLKTVAEGIETMLQATTMMAMRADFLQGYLFSGTLSAQQLRARFSQNGALPPTPASLWN